MKIFLFLIFSLTLQFQCEKEVATRTQVFKYRESNVTSTRSTISKIFFNNINYVIKERFVDNILINEFCGLSKNVLTKTKPQKQQH